VAGLLVVGTLLVDEVLTLDRPPAPGSQQRALTAELTGGGQAWHTCLAAVRAGAEVTVTGRRGVDPVAAELAARLAAAGVRDALVPLGDSRRAVVLDAPPLERAIVSLPPRSEPRALTLPPMDAATPPAWIHIDGYALDDVDGEAVLELGGWGMAGGVPVSLEPPSTAGLPTRRDRLRRLPPLDLLVGRPAEVEAVHPLLATPPRVVVTHDGADPVRWKGPPGDVALAVPPDAPASTLGAGDRFTGGLLAALLRGAGPEDALRAGVAAAHR
jgi:sugar/nucleoside kinase (ribokinase family)